LLTSIVFFFSWWRWPLPLVALHRHGCWAKWAVNLHWRHWMNNVHLLYASACSSLVIGSGLVHFAVCVFFFFFERTGEAAAPTEIYWRSNRQYRTKGRYYMCALKCLLNGCINQDQKRYIITIACMWG
jgi:hypothetical protein